MALTPRTTLTASILPIQDGWRLCLSAGTAGVYRLAQLDDYARLPRRRLPWQQPASLSLVARVSAPDLPGTWGFGLWNDPFGFSLGFGGSPFRLPCLPNAAWFFHASEHNYISFQNVKQAQGFLTQTFRAPRIPSLLLAPAALALPLLAIRTISRWMRRMVSKVVQEDAKRCNIPQQVHCIVEPASLDVTCWHTYQLKWNPDRVAFFVDETQVLGSSILPRGPLGAVIWIDNQFAAWRPDGKLDYGVLENPDAWLEIRNVRLE